MYETEENEEKFAQSFDEKRKKNEFVTLEECERRKTYEKKILRQYMPVDDAYDFIYDSVIFSVTALKILSTISKRYPDLALSEVFEVPQYFLTTFLAHGKKATSLPEKTADFRKKHYQNPESKKKE